VAIRDITTELVDQLAESAVGVAVTLGGSLLGEAVNEDGAKGIVLALLRARRLEEEPAAGGIVHGLGLECEVVIAGDAYTELPIREGEGKRGSNRRSERAGRGGQRERRRRRLYTPLFTMRTRTIWWTNYCTEAPQPRECDAGVRDKADADTTRCRTKQS
jgi:hypothetical protein